MSDKSDGFLFASAVDQLTKATQDRINFHMLQAMDGTVVGVNREENEFWRTPHLAPEDPLVTAVKAIRVAEGIDPPPPEPAPFTFKDIPVVADRDIPQGQVVLASKQVMAQYKRLLDDTKARFGRNRR